MINQELLKKKEAILKRRDEIKKVGAAGKINFSREWYRNVLFYIGQQWIKWDAGQRRWVDYPMEDWQHKSMTNKFAGAVNTIKTILTQKTPRIIVSPARNSDENIATADIADDLVNVIETEAELSKMREINSTWTVVTANCFAHQYYYTSEEELGTQFVPYEMCQGCQGISAPDEIENDTCPKCSQKSKFTEALDPTGVPIGQDFPKGRLKSDPVSAFEMYFNTELPDFTDVRQLVRAKRIPTYILKDRYPEIADTIPSDAGDNGAPDNRDELYLRNLAHMAGSSGVDLGHGAGGSDSTPSATVDYLYCLPDKEFPQGLEATIINNEIAELGDMTTYTTRNGTFYMPFVHNGFNRVPGRMLHKTFMDDFARKQVERNKLQSFIESNEYTMGASQWLVPTGSNMDLPTGKNGQIIEYTHTPKGEEPKKIQGVPLPDFFLNMMDRIDKDMDEIAATYDVLKGQLPQGLDTFAGLRLLTERAFSRHNEMIQNWERFNGEVMKQLFELSRKFFTEPRQRTMRNQYGSWETKEFTKADIQGEVDIKVEDGSTIPKSQAVEQAAIFDSIKAGLIDVQDSQVRYAILEKLGQSDLAGGTDKDIKDAMREWKDFLDSVKANPQDNSKWVTRPRPGIDNEAIHLTDAINRAKTPEFFDLPKAAQDMWTEHAAMHKMNVQAEQQAQAMAQQPTQAA